MSEEPTKQGKPPAMIEFRHVSLSFGEKDVLNDISFRVEEGGLLIITGVSGCGKTVILHLAMGLIAPDEGEIYVGGHPIHLLAEETLLKVRSDLMGLVFQECSLFTSLNAFDNTAYRLEEHNWDEATVAPAVMEILGLVGLEKDALKIPEELSIGMRRRLEIARALAGWPQILFFDEPTSGLDPVNAKLMMDLLLRARDLHQATCLYVTKELHEIPYLTNHIACRNADGAVTIVKERRADYSAIQVLVVDQGKIVFLGTPDDFISCSVPAVSYLVHPETSPIVKSFHHIAPLHDAFLPSLPSK
ncbi:MAG: ATP-binding cassette domain-containing protein [Blastocatellia bacterium]|nr:ATP-binding cassette domain-containing protein [Blastocatellia bacterium]